MIKEILKRRSIRKYKNEDVENEKIQEIIKAGMNAPTARNQKTWEFVVVKDKKLKEEIIEINPFAAMIKEASSAIFVCGRELTELWNQDLAAVTQNMLLEATELELGSCWIGIHTKDEIENRLKILLNIPSDVRIFSIVVVGVSDEEKEQNNKFDEEKIHYEKWNN